MTEAEPADPTPSTTLVLGGTRSGKSAVAEAIAARLSDRVTYLATARVDAADADHVGRVERHRTRRPATWTTVESDQPGALAPHLREADGVVLLDSLGSWLAGQPDDHDVAALLEAITARGGPTVIVSEEVGWSLHAPTAVGRRFVDDLGTLNQRVAARADRVLLVVAGRTLELGTQPT